MVIEKFYQVASSYKDAKLGEASILFVKFGLPEDRESWEYLHIYIYCYLQGRSSGLIRFTLHCSLVESELCQHLAQCPEYFTYQAP